MSFDLDDDNVFVVAPNKKIKSKGAFMNNFKDLDSKIPDTKFDTGSDFEFSRKNAAKLDFGFKTTIISDGANVVKKAQRNGRKSKSGFNSTVIRDGVKVIRKGTRR